LETTKNKYNLIFIDAKKEEYSEYYRLSKLRLKQDGIIVLDNLLWQGKVRQNKSFADKRVEILRQFDSDFLNDNSGKTKIYEIGDGIGVYLATNYVNENRHEFHK
jgi:caffeoyl-CoA O-methyltransferase